MARAHWTFVWFTACGAATLPVSAPTVPNTVAHAPEPAGGGALAPIATLPAWDALSCFAYSTKERSFACLDFDVHADEWPGEVQPVDFEMWTPPTNVAWSGHKAIQLFGGEGAEPESIDISRKEYDDTTAIVHVRTERAAVRALAERGYRPPVTNTPLPSGAWISIRHTWLRFQTRWHEGDASAYAIGSLQLRCAAPSSLQVEGKELLLDRRGARPRHSSRRTPPGSWSGS